jgi:hypothetical protein
MPPCGVRNFGYCVEVVQVRTNSDEEGWHPSKRLKLLVGGKCTADSRHAGPLSRGDADEQ